MKKYNILIVDENTDQIEEFETFFENIKRKGVALDCDFEIFNMTRIDNENDLYGFIVENEIDCVAFDYKLMENNSSFSHQGDVYQGQLLEHFDGYPTFIITNNASDYKLMNADPFKIISKKVVNFDIDNPEDVEEAAALVEKICQLINLYKEEIEQCENEFLLLIEKQNNNEELDENDLRRIVELDTKLENSISKKSGVSKDLKNSIGIGAINNLVVNSEGILMELKKLNNEGI